MTTGDALEQRIRDLSFDAPDPDRITARVLELARTPSRSRAPRLIAVAVAMLVIVAAVLYFVPAADAVLADTPIAGDLLREAGLAGAANRVTSVGAVSDSSGVRLRLIGAYADSTRTVLLLHADPPISPLGFDAELSDQFGWTYAMSEGTSNGLTGDLTVQFQPLAWPDPITGARITLRVSSVQTLTCNGTGKDATCNEGQPLSGSWTLPAILGVDETTALPLPATARLGPATYRFTSVRASAATVEVEVEITGVTMADLTRRIPDGGKGTAVFDVELLGPTGDVVTSSYEISENEQGVHLRLLGYRFIPGDYRFHVTNVGSGEFDRVLNVG